MPTPLLSWPFDEGAGAAAAEALGHAAYDFALTGGTWTTGRVGAALANDGSGSAADFGGGTLDLGTVYTIAVWIRGWDGTNDGVLLAGASGSYAWYLDATDVYHSPHTGDFVTVPHGALSGSGWHHLAVTRDGATVQFYEDGAPVGAPQTLSDDTQALGVKALGAYYDGTFGFAADLDALQVYDVALTAAEIAALVPRFRALLLAV